MMNDDISKILKDLVNGPKIDWIDNCFTYNDIKGKFDDGVLTFDDITIDRNSNEVKLLINYLKPYKILTRDERCVENDSIAFPSHKRVLKRRRVYTSPKKTEKYNKLAESLSLTEDFLIVFNEISDYIDNKSLIFQHDIHEDDLFIIDDSISIITSDEVHTSLYDDKDSIVFNYPNIGDVYPMSIYQLEQLSYTRANGRQILTS